METTAPAKTRKKWPLWLRIALGIVIAIFALIAVAVGLRYWITSDAGRAFIASQIDGRQLGPLGTIRIQGLQGDPLDAATIADITLVDDDGIWLRARDARIEWTPTQLFAGELEIRAVDIRSVNVLRAPRTTYQNPSGEAPDIGLRLEEFEIEELTVAKEVFGDYASYSMTGGAARGRDNSGFARLVLTPIIGPADRANVTAEWSQTGALSGKATLSGPADGLIAALIQPPNGKTVTFDASVGGTLAVFTGDARLAFDEAPVATVSVSRDGDAARLAADVAGDSWPLLDPVAKRAGGPVKLEVEANLADFAKAPVKLRLIAPAGTVDATTTADAEAMKLLAPLAVKAAGINLALVAPPLTGTADATGDLEIDGADFKWTGHAVAQRFTWPEGGAARVSAPLTLEKRGSTVSWATSSAVIDGGRVDALKSLAPARYTASSRGEMNLRSQVVQVHQGQVRGAPGDVTARGTYAIQTGELAFNGSARFDRLADVAPLTGSARGQWSVNRARMDAPIRVTADAQGRNVSSPNEVLSQLAGPEPRVVIAGVVRDGRFTVESGTIDGDGVTATMSGRIADSGAIAAEASGSLTRPVELSGVKIEAVDFTADVTGETDAPLVDLRFSDGVVEAAGMRVAGLGGRADLRLGQAVSGEFLLAGGAADQRLNATGRIEGGEGVWRIVNLKSSLGQLSLSASRLAFADDVFSAEFEAGGPLAGIAGIERGTVSAKGTLTIGDELDIDVSGQITDVRSGQVRLSTVAFEAKGSGNTANVTTHVVGRAGATFDVTLDVSGARAGGDWSGTAELKGKVDQLDVATARPAVWQYGEAGWSVDSRLAAFGGTIDADAALSGTTATATLVLEAVNLRALSRLAPITPMEGVVSGSASFSNGPAPAVGKFELSIANANPFGVEADKVNLKLTGELAGGVFTAKAEGSGQGFRLDASSREQMIVGRGFDVRPDPDAPLAASLDLEGRAEQLWGLFGPEDQSLRGMLEAKVEVGGTPARPTLTGGFTIAEGAYEHGETGLRLADISAQGKFDQASAQIVELSAHDGQGGRLTGDGRIDWTGDVSGGVEFSAQNLRALGRDDRSAVVSGDGAVTLEKDAIHVSGEFTVTQARISVEQPASAKIPTLTGLRRVNFPNREDDEVTATLPPWRRPVQLDLKVSAPRRLVVFGRGLDTEWSADFRVTGPISDPSIDGTATLVRGELDLAGRRFAFDTGTIVLDGPIRTARIDISAERSAKDITARVRVTGSPTEPKFTLESTPSLPQDEVLARVLFDRSAASLSGFEAAQLAAALTQLAGGQAGFDPAGLVRQATGLDRLAFGEQDGLATISAGKYIADNVYLQVGAGGEGGVGAQVEWEPQDNISIISSAQGNGDTKIAVRWKKDY